LKDEIKKNYLIIIKIQKKYIFNWRVKLKKKLVKGQKNKKNEDWNWQKKKNVVIKWWNWKN